MKNFIFMMFLTFMTLGCQTQRSGANEKQNRIAHRVLSIAPSITETIFLLGKGSSIVGVSDFCTWPDSAKLIKKVGGYLDPNFEVILTLKPDLVFILKEQSKVAEFCQAQNIRCVKIDDHNLTAVASSIDTIARYLGVQAKGVSLAQHLRKQLILDTASVKPRIMITIGRDGAGTGMVSSCWVASQGTFYGELISCAGGQNIIVDTSAHYPTITSEAIIRLKPDIIVDLMPSMEQYRSQAGKLKKDWLVYSMIPAVKDSMVFSVSADYATIPSPRIVMLLRDLREIVKVWREKSGEGARG